MQSILLTVVAVAAVIALVGLMTSGAGGTAVLPSLTIAPVTGPAGTTIHVSGTGCPDSSWDTSLHWHVHVQIAPAGSASATLTVTPPSGTPKTPIAFTTEGYPGRADADTTSASAGSWSTDITIPATGDLAAGSGSYPITALCFAAEGAEAGTIRYPSETFVVPPTTPNPSPSPSAPTPLVTSPAFTG
jgi:hypothetical protein